MKNTNPIQTYYGCITTVSKNDTLKERKLKEKKLKEMLVMVPHHASLHRCNMAQTETGLIMVHRNNAYLRKNN